MKQLAFLLVAGVAVIAAFLAFFNQPNFPDLQGPASITNLDELGRPDRTSPTSYATAGPNALAILLKDRDSSWLGLVHGLKSIGIPFRIVERLEEAVQHDVILVYPSLTGANSSPGTLQTLAAHVRRGGTLLAFSVIGGGMPDLFGFDHALEQIVARNIQFSPLPFNTSFTREPEEQSITLTDSAGDGLPVVVYDQPASNPIATFNNEHAAIVHRKLQAGDTYAIGMDIGHYLLRAYNGRYSGAEGAYVNRYQPGSDTFLRFLKQVYHQGEPDAVTVYPTPHDRAFTVLLTHDIDFTQSMDNVDAWVELEQELDVPATYFIQAKYVRDYNDDYFFEPSREPQLRRLAGHGFEIASHTISHSNEFRHMPLGTGMERYPEYRPFVKSFSEVRDASILGELRVSRFLLQTLSGSPVVSFRPGHLSLPQALPQALAATGYRFSSSITANEARTHLPYRLTHDRGYDAATEIFEFPVTIEDEQGRLGDRFDAAVALSEKIARYRGLVNLLIHTETLGHKLEFERRYIETFKDRAWFSTMADYGDWWRMRDSLQVRSTTQDARKTLSLTAQGPLAGLTLQVPDGWALVSGQAGQREHRVMINTSAEQTTLVFSVAR